MRLKLTLIQLPNGVYMLDTFDKNVLDIMEPVFEYKLIYEVNALIKNKFFWKFYTILRTINDELNKKIV